MFNQDRSRYCSYLPRCWQEPSLVHLGPAAWRFSLEDPHTGRRHGFANLEDLIAVVRRELEGEEGEPRFEPRR